jgi:hypothetical protein
MPDSSDLVVRLMVTELQDFVDRWYEALIPEGLTVEAIRDVIEENLTRAIKYANDFAQN